MVFYLMPACMKAVIKIQSARKEFTQDQIAIMRRVAMVLIEHNLSIEVMIKEKKDMELPLKYKLKIV